MTNPDIKSTPQKIYLEKPFKHDGGHAWLAPVNIDGDGVSIGQHCSDLVLFENDLPLGPAYATHARIREDGCGRFSHWKQSVYFAASDNSDPNTNGRLYTAIVTARDASEDCANYGLKMARRYMDRLDLRKANNEKLPFKDLKIFEFEPDPSMSTAMAITTLGGSVYVRGRGPIWWDSVFHGGIASKMLNLLNQSGEKYDSKPLERCIAQNTFDPAHIVILDYNRSADSDMLAGVIDHTVSAAVLEHVENLEAELSFLYDISKMDSKGIHIVDFRDHHNFEKPLEFLTLSDEDFLRSCEYRFSRGSRLRFQELKAISESIGFHVDAKMTDADSAYLKEFTPRLRKSSSRFKDIPDEWLRTLKADVYFQKL